MAAVNFRYLLLVYVRTLIRRRRKRLQCQDAIRRRLPRYWVRPSLQKRKEQGCFHTLFQELRESDRESFFRFCRMSPESFDYLAYMVATKISKKRTKFREPISPEERLSVTLRYLASGEDQQSLSFSYRIGRTTISNIVRETCKAIWDVLKPIYMKHPTTETEWKQISSDFETMWNFPHCIGAIDGKHIAIDCPKKTGSLYYNYKGFYSLVLLAICDAKYCFTLVDIGQYGSGNDSGVLNNSRIASSFESNTFDVPEAAKIQGIEEDVPYFLLGDEIFALKAWLLRPYPAPLDELKRIFNYRLSRARRAIENAFGILAARWRIFRKPIRADVKTVELIVQATLCLHNFLQTTNSAAYAPNGFMDSEEGNGEIIEGDWRKTVGDEGAFMSFGKAKGGRVNKNAKELQESFKDYFNSQNGAVEWQYEYIRRTSSKK